MDVPSGVCYVRFDYERKVVKPLVVYRCQIVVDTLTKEAEMLMKDMRYRVIIINMTNGYKLRLTALPSLLWTADDGRYKSAQPLSLDGKIPDYSA